MARDIDYAAVAVNRAIVEKFGRSNDLQHLTVTAQENTIVVCDGERSAEGTRDDLLAALRGANTYAELWQSAPSVGVRQSENRATDEGGAARSSRS